MDYYEKGEERFGFVSSRIYSFGSSKAMKSFYSFIANDIKKYRPRRILDVGAGPGDLSLLLSKIKKAEVYCVDPSPSMKRIAERKIIKNEIKNVKYELGSSRHILFSEKFDLIVTTISFHHWKEKEKSIKYLLKKLNARGIFIIYEFCYDKLNGFQKMSIGKHSLSIKEAEKYRFKGYKKNIEVIGKIIKLSFAKQS
ncbi:MAG: class I SAM-dependent methyltransferase [Candidatus Parvarchaeum sp.]|nr:class I SAM-dependent methyltransferase [Candidatus Parvarchaeota archaeon]MCW1294257.1 class I SAM-dependent methyltransferase [Candidatus Parvarchaeum tengchongense]MCW1295082.1 class I SAM-dependent methyltransferase [Candidatus Parvarchaeum tengchongense]MCW1299279.1 class I SAM-dependent methyltransferase [Candidatus Parvarchaeum tengchongense]